jgi:hypothetical protein
MSITRDRELADLLYNSVNHLSQLQDDLNVMNSHHQGHQTALTLGENKQGLMDVPHEITRDEGIGRCPEESGHLAPTARATHQVADSKSHGCVKHPQRI